MPQQRALRANWLCGAECSTGGELQTKGTVESIYGHDCFRDAFTVTSRTRQFYIFTSNAALLVALLQSNMVQAINSLSCLPEHSFQADEEMLAEKEQ